MSTALAAEDEKACRGCGEIKPVESFAKKAKRRAARCKDCLRIWAAEYRSTHRDHVRANEMASPSRHPAQRNAWRAANYQLNAERLRAKSRQRYAELYPLRPEIWLAANARRKQRLKVAMDVLDRQLSIAYRRAIRQDSCTYCSRRRMGDMHVDHFFPLAKGGTDHWWNLAQSCGPCNRHKHDRCGTWLILRRGPA
ncbi:HNH endonuclease signature motif containing protein [Streptomyces sp. NPDC006173]|uniref:HNH endonuclease n=1 Tax=Streptomyces sp. NPDC006173 TaxID=3155349 RepID=UPI0033F9F0C6